MSTSPAYATFAMVSGSNGQTIAPFHPTSGVQQSVTGNNATINVQCYHTKVYTTDGPLTMSMPMGTQAGQLKKITFVHKGTHQATVTVLCSTLQGDSTEIQFTEAGDQIELMWTGNHAWAVLSTLNLLNPASNSPMVL